MTDEELSQIQERGVSTLDSAVIELKDTYREAEPYVTINLITGPCYSWDPLFIMAIQYAMSTDSTTQFSKDELEVWWKLVNFENYHSHSALTTDCNGTAIGCTIPNADNESYVVCGNETPMNGENGTIKTLCQNPGYEVVEEDVLKSLDNALMALYNCEEIESCLRDDTLEDVAPCPI